MLIIPNINCFAKLVSNKSFAKYLSIYQGYNIYYSTQNMLPLTIWNRTDVMPSGDYTTHNYLLTNLREDETYFVRLSGYTDLGEGVVSPVYRVKTGRKQLPPTIKLEPEKKNVALRCSFTINLLLLETLK